MVLDAEAVHRDDLEDTISFATQFSNERGGTVLDFLLAFAYAGGIRANREGQTATYFDVLLEDNDPSSVFAFGMEFQAASPALIARLREFVGMTPPIPTEESVYESPGEMIARWEREDMAEQNAGGDSASVAPPMLAPTTPKRAARIDMVREVLADMRGRTFGVDYTRLDGTPRTMLVQVNAYDPMAEIVKVREINLSKRLREQQQRTLFESGIIDRSLVARPSDVLLTDAEQQTAFRTLRLDRITAIRVGGEQHDFTFSGE